MLDLRWGNSVAKSAKFLVSAAADKSKLFQGWCLWNLSTWKTERCTAMYLQPSGGTLPKSSPAWSIWLLSRYGREDLDVLGLTFRKDLYLASSQVEKYLCVKDQWKCFVSRSSPPWRPTRRTSDPSPDSRRDWSKSWVVSVLIICMRLGKHRKLTGQHVLYVQNNMFWWSLLWV